MSDSLTHNRQESLPEPVNYDAGAFDKIRYIRQLGSILSRREGISRWRQWCEILLLYCTRRFGPLLYYELELWRPELGFQQKKRYLRDDEYRRLLLELNPPSLRKLVRHKLAEKSILQSLGVPTAELLGFLHPSEGCDTRFGPLTNAEQLEALLQNHTGERVCFKQSQGSGGEGFVLAEISSLENRVFMQRIGETGGTLGVEAFFEANLMHDGGGGLLLERFIVQHPVLSVLNPDSLNTLRVWVLQRDADVRVLGAVLRIGRVGMVVDNTHGGGIVARVDLDAGHLLSGRTGALFSEDITHHPDTGLAIQGLEIPFFEPTLDLARNALRVFPGAHFAGLDIGITPTGPVVVELNLTPDLVTSRNFTAPLGDLMQW